MPNPAADIFRQAAELNRCDARREGNVVRLAGGCDVLVAGDIHGHRDALARIIGYAALDAAAHRRLVLQEILHGPPQQPSGQDRSVELLLRAARLKLAQPQQVLFVLGNHDVAQLAGSEISKAGRGACKAFQAGVAYAFGQSSDEVMAAIREFLASLPLAVRCPAGTFITHSLPSPARMIQVGTDVLRRPYRNDDLRRGGAVYDWTWGRGHTDEQLDALAELLGVQFFVLGHRHLEAGFQITARRAVTITSDHDRGCIAQFSCDQPLDAETIPACIKPLAALARRG